MSILNECNNGTAAADINKNFKTVLTGKPAMTTTLRTLKKIVQPTTLKMLTTSHSYRNAQSLGMRDAASMTTGEGVVTSTKENMAVGVGGANTVRRSMNRIDEVVCEGVAIVSGG